VAFPVLIAFLISLTLQSLAQPDETPRAEIERLTGVDIAASVDSPDCDTGMMMPMIMTHRNEKPGSGRHHHDATCALCPLLQVGFFILAAVVLSLFSRTLRLCQIVTLHHCRAPPDKRWLLPPAHAPPLT